MKRPNSQRQCTGQNIEHGNKTTYGIVYAIVRLTQCPNTMRTV